MLQPSVASTRSGKTTLRAPATELGTVTAASQFVWDALWDREREHVALDICDAVTFGANGVIGRWLFTSHDKLVRKRRTRTATWDLLLRELSSGGNHSQPQLDLHHQQDKGDHRHNGASDSDRNRRVAVACINGACKDVSRAQVADLQHYRGLEFLVFCRQGGQHTRLVRQTYEWRRSNHKRCYPFMQTHIIVDSSLKLGTCINPGAEKQHRCALLPSVSSELNNEADQLTLQLVAAIEQRQQVQVRRLTIVLLTGDTQQGGVWVRYHHAVELTYTSKDYHAIRVEASDSETDTLTVSSSLRTSFNAIGRCAGDFCAFNETEELLRMQSEDTLSASRLSETELGEQPESSVMTASTWQANGGSLAMTTASMKSRSAPRATRRLAYRSIAQARLEWTLRFDPPHGRQMNESELPDWPAPLVHWCQRQLQQNGVQHGLGARATVLGLSPAGHERSTARDRIRPAAAAMYYDDVGVCRNCYKVYTDLDKRRKASHHRPVVRQAEQDADPWRELEQEMQRRVRAEHERAFFQRLHQSKSSSNIRDEWQSTAAKSKTVVRETSKKVLPPVPWALQDQRDAAAYTAQGSSFVRNIGQKARQSLHAAKQAMDRTTGPDLSHLFDKPPQLPSKPVLTEQRQLPRAPSTLPAKSVVKHKFQHERLMHPWQRELERIKKEEAAAELHDKGQPPSRAAAPAAERTHAGRDAEKGKEVAAGDSGNEDDEDDEDDDDDDDDDDEGIGWSPFLVPVDV